MIFTELAPRPIQSQSHIYIGPMIRIGREIQCLPYAGFFLDNYASVKTNNKYTLFYIRCTKRWISHYGGGLLSISQQTTNASFFCPKLYQYSTIKICALFFTNSYQTTKTNKGRIICLYVQKDGAVFFGVIVATKYEKIYKYHQTLLQVVTDRQRLSQVVTDHRRISQVIIDHQRLSQVIVAVKASPS